MFYPQLLLNVLHKQNGVYKTYLGLNNLTLDVCQFFSHVRANGFMMDILFSNIKQHSNFENGCPFKVIRCTIQRFPTCLSISSCCSFQRPHYFIKEYKVIDKNFPPNIRIGEYRLLFNYYSKQGKQNIFLNSLTADVMIRLKSYKPI